MSFVPTPIRTQDPIIVLAMPRTGSQLLRTLFNKHPDVFIPADSEILPAMFSPELTSGAVDMALREEFRQTYRVRGHLVHCVRELIRNFCTTSGEPSVLGKKSYDVWGMIHYLVPREFLALDLPTLFPHATFIHLVRHPQDVIRSWMSNWEVASRGMPPIAKTPRAVAEMWVRWMRGAAEYRNHVIQLEHLTDPQRRPGEIEKMLKLCKLSPNAVLDGWARELPVINEGRGGNKGHFDFEKIKDVSGLLETMELYGYEPR